MRHSLNGRTVFTIYSTCYMLSFCNSKYLYKTYLSKKQTYGISSLKDLIELHKTNLCNQIVFLIKNDKT